MFSEHCSLSVLNIVSQGPGDRPVVVLFGWAGAKHKHLDKYAELYRWGRSWIDSTNRSPKWDNFRTIIFWTTRDHGCDTVQYILPTRFIFRHTDQVQLIKFLSQNWNERNSLWIISRCPRRCKTWPLTSPTIVDLLPSTASLILAWWPLRLVRLLKQTLSIIYQTPLSGNGLFS